MSENKKVHFREYLNRLKMNIQDELIFLSDQNF